MPDNPQKLWQNQPEETQPLTLELLRLRAADLHTRSRRALIGNTAALTACLLMAAYGLSRESHPLQQLAFAAAAVWAAAGLFFLNRGMWDRPRTGSVAGLELYRTELKLGRALVSRPVRWTLGPVLLTIAAYDVPVVSEAIRTGHPLIKLAPFFLLLGIWMVALLVISTRQSRAMQRELDTLNRGWPSQQER